MLDGDIAAGAWASSHSLSRMRAMNQNGCQGGRELPVLCVRCCKELFLGAGGRPGVGEGVWMARSTMALRLGGIGSTENGSGGLLTRRGFFFFAQIRCCEVHARDVGG